MKIQKKIFFFWGGGRGERSGEGSGWGGQGGCERRTEVFVKIRKKKFFFFFFGGGGLGWGGGHGGCESRIEVFFGKLKKKYWGGEGGSMGGGGVRVGGSGWM